MSGETNKTANPETQQGVAPTASTSGAETVAKAPPTVSDIFGQVVWLMTQSPAHRNFFLSDLEWMVMPALLLRQFRIFPGKNQPIGIALWARITEEAEKRLMSGNARLAPQDWAAGDRLWLLELIAPFGHHDVMMKDLCDTVFAGQTFKMHRTVDGKRDVVTVKGNAPGATAAPAASENGKAQTVN